MRIISNKAYDAEITAAKAQATEEVKGYYTSQVEEASKYIKILESQIRNSVELPWQNGLSRDQLKTCYETNGTVHGIISLISKSVGECAQYLELLDKSGKQIENHWLLDVLSRPNDRYTFAKFMEAWSTSKCVFGDTFVDAPKAVGKYRGRITEMYLLPSYKVGIKHGDWQRLFDGILIQGKTINADEVFESFDINIDDTSYFGFSKLASAATYLSVLEKSMLREAKSLENGGAANLITPANTSLPALHDDKVSAEQELNGTNAYGKNKFLRMPIEVHQLGNSPVDLNILTSHKEAVTALCFVFGIPVDLYYGQAKYENAKEAKKTIYEQVAIPMLHEFGADLLNYLGLAREYSLKVNTDRIDVLQDNGYDVAIKMNQCGAFSTNEIRESAGWEPRNESWANEVRLPMGVQIGNDPIDINEI